MSETVVQFDHVWKKFALGERHDSLRDLIPSAVRRVVGRRRPDGLQKREFWALRDVSFEVKRGAALGIIGPNGAGKSTTLKLLTRILKPTRGRSVVRGRVGALIEVAAGFHPDLTGRENVYLQGAIMGMKRGEISAKLDQIIEFAGVREFIDTQTKRYSSGMQARLGFSVAAHMEPDVLIIDEVLSVGDMAFQERCIERMNAFKREGVAIVFVSHNLQAVASLCESALYLEHEVKAIGPTAEVLEAYVRGSQGSPSQHSTSAIEIVSATLLGSTNETGAVIEPGAPLTLQVKYRVREAVADLTFSFILYRSTDRLLVYDGNVLDAALGLDAFVPGMEFTINYDFRANLTRSQYHLECHVWQNGTNQCLARLSPAGLLTVQEHRTNGGVADLDLRSTVVSQHRPQDLTAVTRSIP